MMFQKYRVEIFFINIENFTLSVNYFPVKSFLSPGERCPEDEL